MEFKIKNINPNGSFIMDIVQHQCHDKDDVFLVFYHNNIKYNTLFDDVLYIYGNVVRKLSLNELKIFFENYEMRNEKGIAITVHFRSPICGFCRQLLIYIREPEDPNMKMIIVQEVEVITEVEVTKEVIKKVVVMKEFDEAETCSICMNSKGYISFGCCSMVQCLECAIKVSKTSKCSQCRHQINYEMMQFGF